MTDFEIIFKIVYIILFSSAALLGMYSLNVQYIHVKNLLMINENEVVKERDLSQLFFRQYKLHHLGVNFFYFELNPYYLLLALNLFYLDYLSWNRHQTQSLITSILLFIIVILYLAFVSLEAYQDFHLSNDVDVTKEFLVNEKKRISNGMKMIYLNYFFFIILLFV